MKKLFIIFLSLITIPANAQVFNSKFDSKNHPKAKGIWVAVKYPNGWELKEGERPNIVQKFSGYYKENYIMLALQILDTGAHVEKECSDMNTEEFAKSFSDKTNNIIVLNVNKTRHEQKPAFIYDMRAKDERAGMSFVITQRIMSVCYKKTIISTICSPMKIDRSNQSITSSAQQLNELNSLCLQFFNSLVLMDKY